MSDTFTQVHVFNGLNNWSSDSHLYSYTMPLQVRMEAGKDFSVFSKSDDTSWSLRLRLAQVLSMDEQAVIVHGVTRDGDLQTVVLTRPGTGWDGPPREES